MLTRLNKIRCNHTTREGAGWGRESPRESILPARIDGRGGRREAQGAHDGGEGVPTSEHPPEQKLMGESAVRNQGKAA